MMQIAFVGLAAGATSALLFASAKSGAFLSFLLFYLAPLPIMMAALGWSHLAAIVAAVTGAVSLWFLYTLTSFFAFLIGVGLPAWWLGYLAMLARPAPEGLEWYPPGRLVAWAALCGALIVFAAIPTFGLDEASFRDALRAALRPMVERLIAEQGLTGVNTASLTELMAAILPATAAVLATITTCVNLWLSARIVKFSGRLNRPWPDLPSMSFPPAIAGLLLAAIVVSLLGGFPGILATVLAAALLMAFGILGFAVLHAITRGTPSRPFVLSGAYIATAAIGWPMLAMTLLGLAEAAFGLRERIARKRSNAPRNGN